METATFQKRSRRRSWRKASHGQFTSNEDPAFWLDRGENGIFWNKSSNIINIINTEKHVIFKHFRDFMRITTSHCWKETPACHNCTLCTFHKYPSHLARCCQWRPRHFHGIGIFRQLSVSFSGIWFRLEIKSGEILPKWAQWRSGHWFWVSLCLHTGRWEQKMGIKRGYTVIEEDDLWWCHILMTIHVVNCYWRHQHCEWTQAEYVQNRKCEITKTGFIF